MNFSLEQLERLIESSLRLPATGWDKRIEVENHNVADCLPDSPVWKSREELEKIVCGKGSEGFKSKLEGFNIECKPLYDPKELERQRKLCEEAKKALDIKE